ncbi:helix-turn-helix domain-containing protein [Streptomyces sp. LUP30]|uniref:helix-turn-helix domain-containing protein n=1 Tax=Streptomyces sp. LUP30 TaxID=1890285 RepID=UPI0009A03A41
MGEREEISRGLCAGESYRTIAGLLGRAVSTISREVSNNGGRDVYRAIAAQKRALDRARRPKQCLLAHRPALRRTVSRHRSAPQRGARSGWRMSAAICGDANCGPRTRRTSLRPTVMIACQSSSS